MSHLLSAGKAALADGPAADAFCHFRNQTRVPFRCRAGAERRWRTRCSTCACSDTAPGPRLSASCCSPRGLRRGWLPLRAVPAVGRGPVTVAGGHVVPARHGRDDRLLTALPDRRAADPKADRRRRCRRLAANVASPWCCSATRAPPLRRPRPQRQAPWSQPPQGAASEHAIRREVGEAQYHPPQPVTGR